MELGISTFGEIPIAHITGGATGAQQRIEELIKEAVLADELGLDVFALGEHHRPDYVVSAPEVVLAGIAAVLIMLLPYLSQLLDAVNGMLGG